MKKTVSEFGRLDILVNIAGITQPVRVPQTTEADWDRVTECKPEKHLSLFPGCN